MKTYKNALVEGLATPFPVTRELVSQPRRSGRVPDGNPVGDLEIAASVSDWAQQGHVLLPLIVHGRPAKPACIITAIRLTCKPWCKSTNQVLTHWQAPVKCASLQALSIFPSLTSVDLSWCQSKEPLVLNSLLQLTSIQNLKLGAHPVEVPSEFSRGLECITTLVSLSLYPTGDLWEFKLHRLVQLTYLHVQRAHTVICNSPNRFSSLFEMAATLPCLHTTAVAGFEINADGWKPLSRLTQIHCLELVSVKMRYQRELQRTAFDAVCRLTNLTGLTIKDTFELLPSINNISALSGLTSLKLHGFDCMHSVADLSSLPALKCCSLGRVFLTDSLDALKHLTVLQELHLVECVLGKSMDDVQALSGLKSLQILHMQYCRMVPAAKVLVKLDLSILTGLTGLRHLVLDDGSWTDADVAQLAVCTGLQCLSLGRCSSVSAAVLTLLRENISVVKHDDCFDIKVFMFRHKVMSKSIGMF